MQTSIQYIRKPTCEERLHGVSFWGGAYYSGLIFIHTGHIHQYAPWKEERNPTLKKTKQTSTMKIISLSMVIIKTVGGVNRLQQKLRNLCNDLWSLARGLPPSPGRGGAAVRGVCASGGGRAEAKVLRSPDTLLWSWCDLVWGVPSECVVTKVNKKKKKRGRGGPEGVHRWRGRWAKHTHVETK